MWLKHVSGLLAKEFLEVKLLKATAWQGDEKGCKSHLLENIFQLAGVFKKNY